MSLENNWSSFFLRTSASGTGTLRKFHVIVDFHPVMMGGNPGIRYLLSVLEYRCGKLDVVGLPGEWRKTHIYVGGLKAVQAAAEIKLGFDTKRIEDLGFVVVENVNPAVPPVLATRLGLGFVGRAKLQVQFEAAKYIGGLRAFLEQAIFHFAILQQMDPFTSRITRNPPLVVSKIKMYNCSNISCVIVYLSLW